MPKNHKGSSPLETNQSGDGSLITVGVLIRKSDRTAIQCSFIA